MSTFKGRNDEPTIYRDYYKNVSVYACSESSRELCWTFFVVFRNTISIFQMTDNHFSFANRKLKTCAVEETSRLRWFPSFVLPPATPTRCAQISSKSFWGVITNDLNANHTYTTHKCSLMREVAEHTRVEPSSRIQKLLAFNRRIQSTPDSVAQLSNWHLNMETSLLKLKGRVLPPQEIKFNGKK